MSVLAMTVLFFAAVIGWFLLAFVPALRELRNGVDARALPVAADGRVTPSYFADRFRQLLTDRLSGPAQDVRMSGETLIGTVEDGERYVVLPARHHRLQPDPDGALDAVVLAVGDLEVTGGMALLREVYVEGSLRTEPDALLRATLAEQGIVLAPRTVSLRWLHSGRDLEVGPECRLFGRASAVSTLRVGVGTAFEKLHAQRIEFGAGEARAEVQDTPVRRVLRRADLGPRAEEAGGRVRYAGDLELPAYSEFEGDLVVTGNLVVGNHSRVDGSVKGSGVEIGDDVRIEGALVSSARLEVGARSRIHGPLLAEGAVILHPHVEVGSHDHPSTLRAERLDVHSGCVVHGSVWTLDGGGEVRA